METQFSILSTFQQGDPHMGFSEPQMTGQPSIKLTGMINLDQIIGSMDKKLSDEDVDRMFKATEEMKKKVMVCIENGKFSV